MLYPCTHLTVAPTPTSRLIFLVTLVWTSLVSDSNTLQHDIILQNIYLPGKILTEKVCLMRKICYSVKQICLKANLLVDGMYCLNLMFNFSVQKVWRQLPFAVALLKSHQTVISNSFQEQCCLKKI